MTLHLLKISLWMASCEVDWTGAQNAAREHWRQEGKAADGWDQVAFVKSRSCKNGRRLPIDGDDAGGDRRTPSEAIVSKWTGRLLDSLGQPAT